MPDGVRVGSDDSVELAGRGRVGERTGIFRPVRGADSTVFVCDVPAGLDLSAFLVGTQVKLHCHRLNSRFRLGFIESERAIVEVPH